MSSEDLVRGRLIVTPTEVALYQKSDKRNDPSRVKQVWTVPIEEIEEISSGKVVGFRKGVTFTLAGGREAKFTISQLKKKRDLIVEALGWNED